MIGQYVWMIYCGFYLTTFLLLLSAVLKILNSENVFNPNQATKGRFSSELYGI